MLLEALIFNFEGYLGSCKFDPDSETYHGRILGIKDLVTYEASNSDDLYEEFIASVMTTWKLALSSIESLKSHRFIDDGNEYRNTSLHQQSWDWQKSACNQLHRRYKPVHKNHLSYKLAS